MSDSPFAPYAYLREWLQSRGIEVHTADLFSVRAHRRATNLFVSFGMQERYRGFARRPDVVMSGFFAFECPVVRPAMYRNLHRMGKTFRRVFSYSTEDALRPFLRGPVSLERFMFPQPFDAVHEDVWERRDRRFLVMINANKLTRVRVNELYTERLRAIEFFNRYEEIDLYGVDWNAPPVYLGGRLPGAVEHLGRRVRRSWASVRPSTDPLWVAVRQAYRGPRAKLKADTLGRYTFAVCFENSILDGWITEKIFDCFYAGTVPIYWGAPDIESWIPSDCFIDMRRFEGYSELREFLHALTDDAIEGYRVAAREFLGSKRFAPFSKQTFAELIGRLVEQDAGISL